MKILHVLYQSTPNISGSSTRSYDLIDSQKENGITPIIITSPFQKGYSPNKSLEIIDGCKYYRTYDGVESNEVSEKGNRIIKRISKFFKIFKFYRQIKKVLKQENVDVIHAHAMFFCAIPSIIIAKKLKIPVVYEIRSLWEERGKEKNKIISRFQYYIIRSIESYSMRKANAVVVINKGLEENIIKRGIKKEKITIVKNGVNSNFINEQSEKITDVLQKDYLNIGYIGSLSPIEGLDNLIKTVIKMNKEKVHSKKFRLLIYGDGISKKDLMKVAANNEYINFMGRVNRQEIYKAYEQIEIIVNPRIKNKLTDSVTPLKPLEAMCFRKPVIVSNVGGMKELIQHNETGILYNAKKPFELESAILEYINLPTNKKKLLIDNAFNYVQSERNWMKNSETYIKLYNHIIDASY
tara:strand:- start:1112 stop:2338 length:1227 start_codon:yes stop_codon:yes gene_type:complete